MESVLPMENVKHLFETGIVEVAPLAYMRGRTLNNCVVILDEAQNATCSQMKMFLTRMGENTKVFVSGDPSQIDLPKKNNSGLTAAINILYKIEEIGFISLTANDVVRNNLVKKIVKAYENEKQNAFSQFFHSCGVYIHKNYAFLILFFVGLFAVSAINFMKITTVQTVANFSISDFEIGQISDRTITSTKF